jgi:hypothetical protein
MRLFALPLALQRSRAISLSQSRRGWVMTRNTRLSACMMLVVFLSSHSDAADYICKDVGQEWTWFSDHVVGSIVYWTFGAPGRHYEVGTGMFFRGRPWGSRNEFIGNDKVTAIGAGALHIRQKDGGAPFKVCITSSNAAAIDLPKLEFQLQ